MIVHAMGFNSPAVRQYFNEGVVKLANTAVFQTAAPTELVGSSPTILTIIGSGSLIGQRHEISNLVIEGSSPSPTTNQTDTYLYQLC